MYKRLKIIVPAAQVLAIVCMFGWERVPQVERTISLYILPTRQIIMNLNFPLVIIWWPIIQAIEWLNGYLPFLREPSTTGTIGIALALFSSIALFWYFVVAEIQMRGDGKSLVRFSNRTVELVKVVVLFLCGVGTLFHAYTETMRPSRHGLSHYGLWPVEIILSLLFLVAWGGTFIGLSIFDFKKLTTNKGNV
jgi:hypothetical protein